VWDIPEVFLLTKFQKPYCLFRSRPLLVIDDKALGLAGVHFKDVVPIGGDLVEQYIKEKDGIDISNCAGCCLVTKVTSDDFQLFVLPGTTVN
jgi:hypothetical protein